MTSTAPRRLNGAPLLLSILILPLAATGALGGVPFWFSPDGTLRVGSTTVRVVVVERDRRDGSEQLAIVAEESDDAAQPSLHGSGSALDARAAIIGALTVSRWLPAAVSVGLPVQIPLPPTAARAPPAP